MTMPKFSVSVEKRMYSTGTYEIEASNADEAMEKVSALINKGELSTSQITDWDDPEYEDLSFQTPGDCN
jgi:hypothetical protein